MKNPKDGMSQGPHKMMQATRRRPDIDALKGILISLIVLSHNYFFSKYFNIWFTRLYLFHVGCFLLLPFLFARQTDSKSTLADRSVRILSPHLFFLGICLALFLLVFVPKDTASVSSWVVDAGAAIVFQSEVLLDEATGFRHLWFLPAMLILVFLLYVLDRAPAVVRPLLVAGSVAYLAGWSLASPDLQVFVPWGSASIAYVLLPGLCVRFLSLRIEWRPGLEIVLAILWIGQYAFLLENHLYISVTGYPPFDAVRDTPWLVGLHYVFLVTSVFFLLRIGWYLRNTVLPRVGTYSLQIFLLHPLVWQIFWRLGGSGLGAESSAGRVLLIACSFVATMAVCYSVSSLIASTPLLSAVLFPRNRHQAAGGWRNIFGAT